MESGWLSVFDVTIQFEQSHLFFPRIITTIMLVLLGIILIKEHRAIMPGVKKTCNALISGESFDRGRFFGALGLMIAYIYLMTVVGSMFPNRGFGFLFVSMPFVFLLGLLLAEERTRRNLAFISAAAIVAPLVSWSVLFQLFNITLP